MQWIPVSTQFREWSAQVCGHSSAFYCQRAFGMLWAPVIISSRRNREHRLNWPVKRNDTLGAQRRDIQSINIISGTLERGAIESDIRSSWGREWYMNWDLKGLVLPVLFPKWGYVWIRKFKDRELHEITWYVQKIVSIYIAESEDIIEVGTCHIQSGGYMILCACFFIPIRMH